MKITALGLTVLALGAPWTASHASAEAPAVPAALHGFPLQPPPVDPRAEVEELQRQTAELHDSWSTLAPADRSQRLAQLQRQATKVQNDVAALPPDQQPEVQARLLQTTLQLADILRMQWRSP